MTAPQRPRRSGRRRKQKRKSTRRLSKGRAPVAVQKFAARAVGFLRLTAIAIGGAIIFSVIWALAYRFAEPPGSFVMVARSMEGEAVNHPWTPLEAISPNLIRAVIAAEDTRFCLHSGIDFDAIEKAVEEKKQGKRLRGASTISQQTAKNAFLWNGGGWARKAVEAWMTVLIETFWPKRRVMEVYLNLAEWGDGHFGAEAAAQARFGKSAAQLTAREAALLAAVLPSPNKWRADRPGPYVRRRAATVESRARQVRRDRLDRCVLGERR